MDTNKIVPMIGIFACLFFLWQAWTGEQAKLAAENQALIQQAGTTQTGSAAIPTVIEGTPTVDGSVPALATSNNQAPTQTLGAQPAGEITVSTDIYDLTISLQGGTIVRVGLKDYPNEQDTPEDPYNLLRTLSPDTFQLQTGLLSSDKQREATHLSLFSATKKHYAMQGNAPLEIPLIWEEGGLQVTKTFIFNPGKYDFVVRQTVANQSATPWSGSYYRQFNRVPPASEGGFGTIRSYTGGAISTAEETFQRMSFKNMRKENINVNNTDGWMAMLQHYFIGAILPSEGQNNNFYSRNPGNNYIFGMTSRELVTVAPNQTIDLDSHFYVGPKIQDTLRALAPSLERAVDYGFLWFIAEPLFKALQFIHGLVGNWGWAIIILTLLIKAVFYPATAMSYRSMAKMRIMGPKMTDIRKRYADDKVKQQQEMMKLYKKEKINPLGGCLPMLIQIPVFISFYWMLNETVELRHAPWMLWYQDLSVKDPFFILPIINGALMFFQQKLNPPPADPMQAKIFQWLPVFFTALFLFFPAGLVLYWVVNSLTSIAQQWVITKRMERDGLKPKTEAKKA